MRSRRGRLWKALRWLLLAASLVSVALVLSPDLMGLRPVSPRTNTGLRADPAPSERSYPIEVAREEQVFPGVTLVFVEGRVNSYYF